FLEFRDLTPIWANACASSTYARTLGSESTRQSFRATKTPRGRGGARSAAHPNRGAERIRIGGAGWTSTVTCRAREGWTYRESIGALLGGSGSPKTSG